MSEAGTNKSKKTKTTKTTKSKTSKEVSDSEYDSESEEEEINEDDQNYHIPDDVVASVRPSHYLQVIYQEPITHFDQMGNRVPEFIKLAKYSEIPDYLGHPITETYKMFINAINEVSREQISTPPDNIADFTNYISGLIPQKACYPIASAWPPAIPRITNPMEPLCAILIKILSEASDPVNILRLLSFGVFPKVWTNKPCTTNSRLLAISPVIFKKKPKHWAYIERDTNQFYVVGLNPKTGKLMFKSSGIATRCAKSKDKKSVIVKGETGRITEFEPMDPEVVSLWTHLYQREDDDDDSENKKNDSEKEEEKQTTVPFIYFLTKDLKYYPDIFYGAFYEAFTANDFIMFRALVDMDPPYSVVKSMLNVMLYSRKIHMLFGSVVGRLLETDKLNPLSVYTIDSFYRKFVHAIWEKFGEEYINNFLKKIIALIDNHQSFDERLFFTVAKYIMMSYQYIPLPIRHFASVLRSYATTKFNSRGFVYFLLGGFFGLDFICPVIAHPEKYMNSLTNKKGIDKIMAGIDENTQLELKHPLVLQQVSEMLQYLFHGALLPDRFKSMNNRMKKHTIPEMEEFLFSLGDLENDIVIPSPPTKEELTPALERLMHFMMKRAHVIRKTYDEAMIPQGSYPPQIGWNFSATFSDFFRQCYDRGFSKKVLNGAKRVKPNPLKFPALPLYGTIPPKKGQPAGPQYGFDDTIERGFLGPPAPPSPSMRLPQKPKTPKYNPVNSEITDSESSFEEKHSSKRKNRK